MNWKTSKAKKEAIISRMDAATKVCDHEEDNVFGSPNHVCDP